MEDENKLCSRQNLGARNDYQGISTNTYDLT